MTDDLKGPHASGGVHFPQKARNRFTFPCFESAVIAMAVDNALPIKSTLGPMWLNLEHLEIMASRMKAIEIQTFIQGECSEVDALVKKYSLGELDKVFNSIFDGELHDYFFEAGYVG